MGGRQQAWHKSLCRLHPKDGSLAAQLGQNNDIVTDGLTNPEMNRWDETVFTSRTIPPSSPHQCWAVTSPLSGGSF